MTFLEALASNKKFRVVGQTTWFCVSVDNLVRVSQMQNLIVVSPPSFSKDWLLSDFEVEEKKVEITRADLEKAFSEYGQGPYMSSTFVFICKKLGL